MLDTISPMSATAPPSESGLRETGREDLTVQELVDRISALAGVVHRAQLHTRRHCDCKQMSMACVKCETRLLALHALDQVEDLRDQMRMVEAALDDAARMTDALMDGIGDCYECQDLRAEIAPLRDQ